MNKAIILITLLLLSNRLLASEILVKFQPIQGLNSGEVQDGTKLAKGSIHYNGFKKVNFYISDNLAYGSNHEIKLTSITRPEQFIIANIEGDGWIKSKDRIFINVIKGYQADFYLVTSGKQKVISDRWKVNLSVGISEYD